MRKSNPTTRPPVPNYEIVDGMIYRYEPMNIAEAFGALSQVKEPFCGFRDADFESWNQSQLYYVYPGSVGPFRTKAFKYKQCARITIEDPRKVPKGVPELPEPWLAYVGAGPLPHDKQDFWVKVSALSGFKISEPERGWMDDVAGSERGWIYAVDVRTAFAREHFSEYVEALGYLMEEAVPERIQLTDTQLLDKLAEAELRFPDGRQCWKVFTDRGDPQMTVREAIAAWGADE